MKRRTATPSSLLALRTVRRKILCKLLRKTENFFIMGPSYKMGDFAMNTRMEHDTMGPIAVPAEHHWGAQTQRSIEHFKIGGQRQPREIITAFAYLKEACARANAEAGKLTAEQAENLMSI